MIIIRFLPTVGVTREEIPFETPETVQLQKVLNEVGKKLNLNMDDIAIYPLGSTALSPSEYITSVGEIVAKYGVRFRIINRGDVG
ncbi:MAG: hypothetical protein OEZ01_16270 [Candidatus Heimdallarchaeota archaeon]|nr:hypothetical protein [Candidatus Heimdallarchaeota archaeon]